MPECEKPKVDLEYKDLHVSLIICVNLKQFFNYSNLQFSLVYWAGWKLTCDELNKF